MAPSGTLCRIIRSVRRLLVTANVVPSSPILVSLMKEALSYSKTSVLIRAARRNISEDGILHSHSRKNLKSYICIFYPWQDVGMSGHLHGFSLEKESQITT
jgi:hypothetical protein